MTTHQLAKTLEILATALRSAPNADLKLGDDLSTPAGVSNRPVNLAGASSISLARLKKYSKSELVAFLHENDVPVAVRQKDSASNVMQRLTAYLQANKTLRKKIRNKVAHGKTSPELTSALSYLLRENYE